MTKKKQIADFFSPEIPDFNVDVDLLEYLERTFPNTLPAYPYESEVDYAIRIGNAQVVKHIRALYEKKR